MHRPVEFVCNCMVFSAVFNSISLITEASASTHAFLEFFPSHWLLSSITISEKPDSSERGMNHVCLQMKAEIRKVVSEKYENIVHKGENDQHFLRLPQCFQKSFLSGLIKPSPRESQSTV